MTGRGLLGRFGPNHAADPIVTRYGVSVNVTLSAVYAVPCLALSVCLNLSCISVVFAVTFSIGMFADRKTVM